MINVAISYNASSGVFQVYEPTTDTLLVTASITESFVKLSEFLQQQGMTKEDILNTQEVTYHIDSATFIAMVESNVALLKRLNSAPSGFAISGQRFGLPPSQQQGLQSNKGKSDWKGGKKRPIGGGGTFSKSSFNGANKKFGNN